MLLRKLFLVSTACMLMLASAASAQEKQLLLFSGLKGKVVAVNGNIIQWTDNTGAEMYVQITDKSKTQVLGDVEPSFLQQGMFIRFPADITKRGKITGDVLELTIFSPNDGFSPGVFEDGPVDPKAASNRFLVSGQVTAVKNTQLTVNTGEHTFKFKLADGAKMKIDVSDYSIARPDDEINITGTGEDKSKIVAKGIEVTLATPLEGEEKKGRRSSTRKPRDDS